MLYAHMLADALGGAENLRTQVTLIARLQLKERMCIDLVYRNRDLLFLRIQ
jgi:hypothetical protein